MKSKYEFSYVNEVWPRSRLDFDLEYSHILMNSIKDLHLRTFSSQAAIVSENPLFSLLEKHKIITKLDIAIR